MFCGIDVGQTDLQKTENYTILLGNLISNHVVTKSNAQNLSETGFDTPPSSARKIAMDASTSSPKPAVYNISVPIRGDFLLYIGAEAESSAVSLSRESLTPLYKISFSNPNDGLGKTSIGGQLLVKNLNCPQLIVKIGQGNPHQKGGGFHVSKFLLLVSSVCLLLP